MSMSKKDFEALARILRDEATFAASFVTKGTRLETIGNITSKLAGYCQTQNGAFDRERFLRACDPASVASKPRKGRKA